MSTSIADMRKEYTQRALDITDVAPDPIQQFTQWFEEARKTQVPESNAMHLATVSALGKPSGRIVLLKGIAEQQFLFYTNYQSRKGQEIAHTPYVCLTFFWPELERQIRIEGTIHRLDEQTSTDYFHSRPRESQIGAWVSPQSQTIEARSVLDERRQSFTQKFAGQEIPKPPHWGGYAVTPESLEFWQGRPSRLHDRIFYQIDSKGQWQLQRLAP